MIRINLIPHRAQFRQLQIIEYLAVFTSAILLVVFLIIVVDVWETDTLTDLQEEQASLKAQNAHLSKKIGELRNLDNLRKEVEGKLEIVDELQAGRFRTLVTLDAIAQGIPQNIWVKRMKDSSGSLSLDGYGESSKAVANFMRALESSVLFDDVRLKVDQSDTVDGVQVRRFTLDFRRLTLAEQEAAKAKLKGEVK